MKTIILLTVLVGLLDTAAGQANETHKACQAVISCFQDAEDEINKCLSILIGEKSSTTESPKANQAQKQAAESGDCMTPIKEKIKQKKALDQERVQDFKKCLNQRIEAGAEDVDPRKYRYCSTVTGRYQNKTAEATNKKVRRQVQQQPPEPLPQLPIQSANNATPGPINNQSEYEATSIAPLSSAIQPVSEPKNATFVGGGIEQSIPLANSSSLEITSKPLTSLPAEPSSHSAEPSQTTLGSQTQSGSQLPGQTTLGQAQSSQLSGNGGQTQTSQLSGLSQTQTSQLSGLSQAQSSQIPELVSQTNSSQLPSLTGISETTTSQIPSGLTSGNQPNLTQAGGISSSSSGNQQLSTIQELSSSHQLTSTASSNHLQSTTESEYEESGGSSSEINAKPAVPAVPAAKPEAPVNPVIETLNLNNVSEPLGPPVEDNSTQTATQTTAAGKIEAPGGAPGARSPGTRLNGHKAQRPVGAADIDAGASDQDNQQRVKVELLRETRRRLSEFKGCMARARIKREECKPLVRCCPDTAMCHLNYESSDLHNKVHKLESEIVQGRQDCLKQKRSSSNKDESSDALDQIDAEELISDDSVVSQAIF